MKNKQLLNILMVLLLSTVSAAHAGKIGVAATVQGKEISEVKLQKSVDSYLRQQGTEMGAIRDPRRFKDIREKVLNVLIGQELLWQAAAKAEIIASDEDIKQALEQYKSQFDDEVSFQIKIKEGGYNLETFQVKLKQELSAQKWVEKNLLKDVAVSDAEIHTYYLENQEQFIEPERVRARHILIQVKPDASDAEKEAAMKRLQGLKKEIDSGADFAALARQQSEDGSAPNGGDLGFFQRGQMVAPFEKAAFGLAPGEVSKIIETRFGFHLIKLVEKKPSVLHEEKEQAEKVRFYLWQQKYQRVLGEAVKKLESEALIVRDTLYRDGSNPWRGEKLPTQD